MKTFVFATIVSLFTLTVNAQHGHSAHSQTENAGKQASLSAILPSYYEIKNALINGDAAQAAGKAEAFAKALNAVDMNAVGEKDMNALMAAQQKLSASTSQIAASNNIADQRQSFAALSADLFTLAKSVKLADQPVYQFTCPMKKTTWLSNETTVKNPYFGKQMLTCGKITETIK